MDVMRKAVKSGIRTVSMVRRKVIKEATNACRSKPIYIW